MNKKIKKKEIVIVTLVATALVHISFSNLVQNATAEEIIYPRGDVNYDGKVNMKDVVALQRYVNGWSWPENKDDSSQMDDSATSCEDIINSNIIKLIETVPNVDDIEKMAEWFAKCEQFAKEENLTEIRNDAWHGLGYITNSSQRMQDRLTILSRLKALIN